MQLTGDQQPHTALTADFGCVGSVFDAHARRQAVCRAKMAASDKREARRLGCKGRPVCDDGRPLVINNTIERMLGRLPVTLVHLGRPNGLQHAGSNSWSRPAEARKPLSLKLAGTERQQHLLPCCACVLGRPHAFAIGRQLCAGPVSATSHTGDYKDAREGTHRHQGRPPWLLRP